MFSDTMSRSRPCAGPRFNRASIEVSPIFCGVASSFIGSLFPPPREWVPLSERDAGLLVVFPQQVSLRTICRHARPRCDPPRNRRDAALPRDAGLNGCGIPRNSPSLLFQASVTAADTRWTKSSQAGSLLSTTRCLLPVQRFCSGGPAFLLEREIPSFCIRK
jgi:hypothetical protein